MDFTESQLKRIKYFSKSVRLDNPKTLNDPAYQFSDEDLQAILEFSAPIHRGLTIDETPDSEFYMVLLLAKREVYYRLATTTAPFFKMEVDDSRLEKNMRFDHYMKLVESVIEEYDKLYEQKFGKDGQFGDVSGTGGVITVYNSKLYGKPYLRRYNQLNDHQTIDLVISGVGETTVNLDWNKYYSTHGADFKCYEVYVSEEMIYDEYSPVELAINIAPIYTITDPRKTKIRVSDLEPGKVYHVLLKSCSLIGNDSFEQLVFTTMGVRPFEGVIQ